MTRFTEDACLEVLESHGFTKAILVEQNDDFLLFQCLKGKSENAVKCYSLQTHDHEYKTEAMMLQYLDHPNIITFREAHRNKYIGIIATEWMECDMMEMLQTTTIKPEMHVRIFQQVCSAVEYIHSKGIAHLDIRPENVWIERGTAKLVDFAVAQSFDDNCSTRHCGTLFYCAPEVLQKRPYLPPKADIWSLGILLHVLLTKSWPYCGTTKEEMEESVRSSKITFNLGHLSNQATSLIDRMLDPDPMFRPMITEVLHDSWFTSLGNRASLAAITRSISVALARVGSLGSAEICEPPPGPEDPIPISKLPRKSKDQAHKPRKGKLSFPYRLRKHIRSFLTSLFN
mmetsp:Transcript_18939/g.23969  ORF Transcript_18939/g.23969 Transcript_18939/m.23969 type:complete len:343 (-) Transcript_18939:46-1074(-)|eukprot:CAMPEP_0206189010 /NCGR_PEP_ID=MMETSP0166-20121206/3929_1 /ASSEMBLY_ACC=CAM_ASM_000260 /TAXON_ID=95228 /ORGANISM="Vannella robusta, Strain DIVA3 518/3/11/1/6" /LENGTH=342 /DNA_ID=CAMNT_0053604875 /DNA_START=1931 /DNA_END=2959 /DNA_ORIENTATION=+